MALEEDTEAVQAIPLLDSQQTVVDIWLQGSIVEQALQICISRAAAVAAGAERGGTRGSSSHGEYIG